MDRRARIVGLPTAAALVLTFGCADPSGDDGGAPGTSTSSTTTGVVGPQTTTSGESTATSTGADATTTDAPHATSTGASETGDETDETYRNSLSICWTDATCPRVFAVAHGGMWSPTGAPYDSDAALQAAYDGDVDAVKIDVRVTMDDVPVIAHSSPIEFYESLDCAGRRIEEMTADEVTQCHRLPSATETFQRLDDVLAYLRGKMVVQLTVKLASDYARTIEVVHAASAQDYAFLEISPAELQELIPSLAGADDIYFLINVAADLGVVDTLIDTVADPRAFMFEFDPDVDVADLVATRLHPAGIRSFTYTDAAAPSAPALQALFEAGFDAVSSQAAANGVEARKLVNASRGVDPP